MNVVSPALYCTINFYCVVRTAVTCETFGKVMCNLSDQPTTWIFVGITR